MDKLSQYCSLMILDDHSFYTKASNNNGKIMLIDPYDYETLQIFFDVDLDTNMNKIDVIDIVNKKKLDNNYCLNKFVVNIEPRRAIIDPNYFFNRIEMCEANRIAEIRSIGVKEVPLQPIAFDFDVEKEIRRLPSDKYLEMTIFPLLHTVSLLFNFKRP